MGHLRKMTNSLCYRLNHHANCTRDGQ